MVVARGRVREFSARQAYDRRMPERSQGTGAAEQRLRPNRLDPLSDPAWRAFLDRSPDASIFHHPAWLRLLHDHYGYEVQARCVSEDGRGLVGGLPVARVSSRLTGKRLVALPFSDICPPLVAGADREGPLDALAAMLAAERRQSGLDIEIHAEMPGIDSAFVVHRFHQHVLPLQADVQAVESNFSKSQVKRGIAKARREGLVAERRTDRDALEDFYRLHLQTRRRQGVPTQPKRFILSFADLFEGGLGFVLLVRLEELPVAAAVFLTFKDTITYKYGASDARHLNRRPNNLLFAEAIRWACEDGFRSLDFGRTNLDNPGLASFKRSWGAVESELGYTYLCDEPPSTEAVLQNRIMAGVITRSPRGVGRLVGEALNKHFG